MVNNYTDYYIDRCNICESKLNYKRDGRIKNDINHKTQIACSVLDCIKCGTAIYFHKDKLVAFAAKSFKIFYYLNFDATTIYRPKGLFTDKKTGEVSEILIINKFINIYDDDKIKEYLALSVFN